MGISQWCFKVGMVGFCAHLDVHSCTYQSCFWKKGRKLVLDFEPLRTGTTSTQVCNKKIRRMRSLGLWKLTNESSLFGRGGSRTWRLLSHVRDQRKCRSTEENPLVLGEWKFV